MARGLGKGLEELFGVEEESVQELPIDQIRPNPYQPRKNFEADAIEELKDSIIQYGVLQPIIVRKAIKGFEIVVGERRFRASKEASLNTIPAVVRELTDEQMMELALLENLQREDLSPMEEAEAYERLINELNIKQDDLAKRLGKSRPHIANMLRLLSLPEKVRAMINSKELSMGHGRALLALKEEDEMVLVANKIRKEHLNVRQVEKLITQLNEKKKKKKKTTKKDVFISSKEAELRDFFGTSVNIQQGKRKGKIEIEYYNQDDFNRILEMLTEK
ncbi:ParB/RepB/Spo0J family partition protein [Tenuibacillus multivorans]|uniref:Chromosome partitioning protein, ParB family n=1 Tax=Tenuibacillus multivorans TaxID=237069 RepID=A0A1G9W7B7_9BACI|nr:ParB/RepB/Spo0J family partition protein [Tenuibacillus multivorans]GEL76332.1 stage 0 sporulation protein J [Tenuibacillus multivorans]SDM80157.1 chromosome partitioning protein, ParB family [Tenuibacillus multivorans]